MTLFGYGINVHVHRGHLTVRDGIGSNRRSGRFSRVRHGLKRLVVIGSDGMVSLAAIRWLADQDCAFVMLDRLGEFLAVTGPVHPTDARLRRAQSLADESRTGLRIAVELIRQKLVAQERLAREQFQNEVSAETISNQRHALTKAGSKEEIRRCEAHAALAYWKAWHELRVPFQKADLQRIPEHWRTFGSRISPLTKSPRLAVNPPNAMLNYLYAVLESEARLALSELGLDPGIGMLHSDTRTRDSLACDLMEPIRPQVDSFLLNWLGRAPLQRKWFFEERGGNCRLTSEFAAELSGTSKAWRQALGPVAEWITRTLWSTMSRSSHMKVPATRLTQDRKREAKGIPIVSPNGTRDTLTLQRDKALVLPVPARLYAHDSIARARRADTQRRQAAASRAWNVTQNPDSLDESFYRKKIQPHVAGIPVPVLVSVLGISEPYARDIRAGRRPHPRHWRDLAKLVDTLEQREDAL